MKKPIPTPTPRTKPVARTVRYQFNIPELLDIGKRLAETQRALADLEADKSRCAKDFTARISQQEMEGGALVTCISSGYEMRTMPCTITYHDPVSGKKTTRRDDNGEVVDVQDMVMSEMQEELPLDAQPEAEAEMTVKVVPVDRDDETQSAEPTGDDLFDEGYQNMADRIAAIKVTTDVVWLNQVVRCGDLQTDVRVAAEKQIRKLSKSK